MCEALPYISHAPPADPQEERFSYFFKEVTFQLEERVFLANLSIEVDRLRGLLDPFGSPIVLGVGVNINPTLVGNEEVDLDDLDVMPKAVFRIPDNAKEKSSRMNTFTYPNQRGGFFSVKTKTVEIQVGEKTITQYADTYRRAGLRVRFN